MFVGDNQARISQDFQNLMKMMEMTFSSSGGGGSSGPPAKTVQTVADMQQFMKGFG